MAPSDSPLLPVLPKRPRRRATLAPQSQPMILIRTAPPKAQMAGKVRYRHAGVIALCISAVAMVGALVTFSIMRDAAWINRTEPVIAVPLRP